MYPKNSKGILEVVFVSKKGHEEIKRTFVGKRSRPPRFIYRNSEEAVFPYQLEREDHLGRLVYREV